MHDHLPLACFIVCDNGPAVHFAEFAKCLLADGKVRIDIYTSESARTKFNHLSLLHYVRVFHFALNESDNKDRQNLATELIKNCVNQGAQTIIVDIANKFNINLQVAFSELDTTSCSVHFWCYYDNPEECVPGEYSIRSREMMKLSQNILFANVNLIRKTSKIFSMSDDHINFNDKNIQGIGYYPIETANKLRQQRQLERKSLREKYRWINIKYLFIYIGGNNQVYYEKAFPAFLSFISNMDKKCCEDTLFLIHQHPAAKLNNQDGLLFQKWQLENCSIPVFLSPLTTDEVQLVADGILYYQTSMTAQFALIGLPIMQVAHETYEDILVKHNLCETANNSIEFMNGLKLLKEKAQSSNSEKQNEIIYDIIGYKSDWLNSLQNIILGFK